MDTPHFGSRFAFVLVVILIALAPVVSFAQPLELVQSTLVVPQKYQQYFDSSRTINLPRGFTASVFYTGNLESPRFMAFNPDGDLCIADNSSSKVLTLPDADSDGVADTAYTIATGTDQAHSIAFHDGSLFAASANHVWRYDTPSKYGEYAKHELFIDSIGSVAEGAPNHTTRTLLFDDASQSLFVSVGAPCNACRERDTTRASIQRYDLNGKLQEIYATGLRNAVGLAMDSTHQLWATVAERNYQGADVPQDLVTHITKNGFYGWPFSYGDHQWVNFAADSEYNAMLPLSHLDSMRVSTMLPPDVGVAAHSTPLGIVYCKNAKLPPVFDNSFLVAIHGSFQGADGRLIANGSKITMLSNVLGTWTAQDFCTGLLTDSINYARWARPCGIIMDPKGNIYFSSDNTALHATPAVFRISYDPSKGVERTAPEARLVDLTQEAGGWLVSVHSNERCEIHFFDMLGRQRSASFVERGSSSTAREFHLDSSKLEHGVYWIVVECGGQRIARKIIQ